MLKMQQTAMLKKVCAEDDVQEKLYYAYIQKDGQKNLHSLPRFIEETEKFALDSAAETDYKGHVTACGM